MIIIADSSPLIALATCGALPLLIQLTDDVRVPPAVYAEVTHSGKPFAADLFRFLNKRVQNVDIDKMVIVSERLGQGEIEAMSLYKAADADYLLIDDRYAKRIAEANGIRCIGALRILLMAKEAKAVETIRPYIEQLRQSDIYYGDALLDKVLMLAGEVGR